MPGINLLATSRELSRQIDQVFYGLQQSLLHFTSFEQETFVATEKAIIGLTAYPHYPRVKVETDYATAVLEGFIYNKDIAALRNLLDTVASGSSAECPALEQNIASFVSDADGEFLVVVYDKRCKRLLFFNDILGRLPFYYAKENDLLIASREVKFIVPLLQSLNFNKEAMMQYLLYGFPFADTTFVEGVRQLAPGTIITFDYQSGALSETTSKLYDIESVQISRPNAVKDMKDLFLSGLSHRLQRFGDHKAVVSLSGGLDSRATLAGISALHRDIQGVTMDSAEKALARECAEAFRIPIETVSKPDGAAPSLPGRSVFLSDGLDSHPQQEDLHHFLDYVYRTFGGQLVYYTGYFGGEITRYAHMRTGLRTMDSLVRYLLWANDAYKYDTYSVTRILGIDHRVAHDSLAHYLSSFPDNCEYKRYLRFRYAYDRHFIGHAEDRSRFYFWTATPFSSLDLFRFIVSLDGNLKNTRLFRDFLLALDPRTCALKYYNYGLSLASDASMCLCEILERAAKCRAVKTVLRPLWRRYKGLLFPETSNIMTWRKEILALIDTTEDVRDYFCVEQCREVVRCEENSNGLARMLILFRNMKYMRECRQQVGGPNKLLHGD